MRKLLLTVFATLFAMGSALAQPEAESTPRPAQSFNPTKVMKMAELPKVVAAQRHVLAAAADDIITE